MTQQPTLELAPPPGKQAHVPLADRMRPQDFSEIIGQQHLFSKDSLFLQELESGVLPSMILWGPPGCGKTTIARLLAGHGKLEFIQISAISHATTELRAIFETAKAHHEAGKNTLLMVDEIHRFNRAQQDLFLPYIEDGTIILVGTTTENPSFELNAALLSRCKVVILNRLEEEDLLALLDRAENFEGKPLSLTQEAKNTLVNLADGDARYLLNLCEECFTLPSTKKLDADALTSLLQKRFPRYDKSRDEHYNLISALHKSLRGSDVDAALYWLNRMLSAGEDPLYIVRRLVRFAVEDIGLADPEAVHQSLAAKDTYDFIGSPEGELAIAQAVIYLATAPKSNAGYSAYKTSLADAKQYGSLTPPKHILNAPTKLMKEVGYGKGYEYDHNTEDAFSGQNYFPEEMARQSYYRPVQRGFERELVKRLEYWQKLRAQKSS